MKFKNALPLFFFLSLFSISLPAFALFYRGGDLGVGTRAMGLSGAFVAVSDDASAPYWNPAGLAQITQPEVMVMYGSYFNDKDRNLYISGHYPLSDDIHLALGGNFLFYTDIPGGDENSFMGSVAIPMDFVPEKKLLFGANFHYFFSDLGTGNGLAEGFGVDIGLLFRQPFKDNTAIKLGLVLSDISTDLRFDNSGVEQAVPAVLTAGLAYQIDPMTLVAVDVPWTLSDDTLLNEQNVRLRSGLEHWFFDGRFGLRAGFISFLTLPGEFSLGASYKTADWSVDYAFMNHSENLGNSHRVDATYYFEQGSGKPDPKPYMVQSLVGDQKIYLKWDIPEGSEATGYLVYIRRDDEKDFSRAKQELLQTRYCLLKGAKNGVRYHVFIRSVVGDQEKFACNEWVVTAQPMSEAAQKYYEQGLAEFKANHTSTALFLARKAEEFDPNNYDIKNLIQKLETTHHEGLVPEEDKRD
jgi:hypothetical protein